MAVVYRCDVCKKENHSGNFLHDVVIEMPNDRGEYKKGICGSCTETVMNFIDRQMPNCSNGLHEGADEFRRNIKDMMEDAFLVSDEKAIGQVRAWQEAWKREVEGPPKVTEAAAPVGDDIPF
jgi:hypothetical protein